MRPFLIIQNKSPGSDFRRARAKCNDWHRHEHVIKGQAVQAKLDELGIKITAVSSCSGNGDFSSYQAGKAAGDRASFGRPVSGRNAALRLR
jgi:hypothetical protein